MATGHIAVTEGSGKNIASHSISEDAITKELQRMVPSSSAGVEQDAIGVTSGAAVVTDADGTIQGYLRGLVKLVVDKITVAIGTFVGAANLAHGQVSASTTAGTLVASRATRRSVVIKNMDTGITVYVGKATVTAGNGLPLGAGESVSLDWTGLVQVISASGTPTVAYMETYD